MATALTQTTLSAAVGRTSNVLPVASATGISAPVMNVSQQLYIIGPGQARGELMTVVSVSGTQIGVSRLDEFKSHWPSGSLVLIGPVPTASAQFGGAIFQPFQTFDPTGANASAVSAVTAGVQITPFVNVTNGNQWLWSTITLCWVPGWQNTDSPACTAAVASAAGVILPSGPLFHVTGALAVTGFTIPVGFTHGSFTVIPDGTFTWTAAGNIAVLGTAVVNRALTFTWDATNSKFIPSYV